MVKVENLTSPRSGRPVANQFMIETPEGEYFQSYRTVIALRSRGKIVLDPDWEYSTTTAKYRNQFTGLDTKETRKQVKAGQIEIRNLNV